MAAQDRVGCCSRMWVERARLDRRLLMFQSKRWWCFGSEWCWGDSEKRLSSGLILRIETKNIC